MLNTNDAQPAPERAGICPFCGGVSQNEQRCDSCGGLLDPLSRQATQNDMGPWFIRDARAPFRPGCSYQRIVDLVEKGRIGAATILRGPSTKQFWMPARRVPGIAQALGVCHSCQRAVSPSDQSCSACGASFGVSHDRQTLGLGPIRPLPGQAPPEVIAAAHSGPVVGHGGQSGHPQSHAGPPEARRTHLETDVEMLSVASSHRSASRLWIVGAAAGLAIFLLGLAAADVFLDLGLGVRSLFATHVPGAGRP